jgi:hypothetical protein
MEQLERYRQIASRLELDRFVMAHGGLYLLGRLPDEGGPDEEQWTFTTQPGAKLDDVIRHAAADKGERLLAGRFLRKLEKSDRNPWLGRLSVGRAANNDVVIRHPSVSKLHAHFGSDARLSQPGNAPMTVRVMDVGSRNGTSLNGQALEPDVPRPTGSGDVLVFGNVTCELLDAGALHQKLRAVFPTPEQLEQRLR